MGERERIEALIAEYNATYCGGMGGGSEAFLRRFLEWQGERDADAIARSYASDDRKLFCANCGRARWRHYYRAGDGFLCDASTQSGQE